LPAVVGVQRSKTLMTTNENICCYVIGKRNRHTAAPE